MTQLFTDLRGKLINIVQKITGIKEFNGILKAVFEI